MSELWFLSFAYRLIWLFISVKFKLHENISNNFQIQGRTKTTVFIVQRGRSPKVVKPRLWLLSSAHRVIMVLYISAKFHNNGYVVFF